MMTPPVVFSPRVITTLNSLPEQERGDMAAALTSEFLLGIDASEALAPVQRMVYAIISSYVRHDMRRAAQVVDLCDIGVV